MLMKKAINHNCNYLKHIFTHVTYLRCLVLVPLLALAFIFLSKGNCCVKYLCVKIIVGMLPGMIFITLDKLKYSFTQ